VKVYRRPFPDLRLFFARSVTTGASVGLGQGCQPKIADALAAFAYLRYGDPPLLETEARGAEQVGETTHSYRKDLPNSLTA
jgi:hypothetical protein